MGKDTPPSDPRRVVARAQDARAAEASLSPTLNLAVGDLIEQHQGPIFALCLRIVGDRERAAELAQEALLTGWRRLPEFHNSDASLGTWLHAIARNLCYNAVRKKRELLTIDGVVQATDLQTLDVLAGLRRQEREALLQAAGADLAPVEQEAIYLRYVEGVPLERITEILELEGRTGARGLLQRCRRKLGRGLRARLAEMGHTSSFIHEP